MDYKDRKSPEPFISKIQGMVEKASKYFDSNKLDNAISTLKAASKDATANGQKELNQLIFPNLLRYLESKSILCFEQADVVGGMNMFKEEIEVLLESDYSDKKVQIEILRNRAVAMVGPRLAAQCENTAESNAYLASLQEVFKACEKVYEPGSLELDNHRELLSKLLSSYATNLIDRHSSQAKPSYGDTIKKISKDNYISFESQLASSAKIVDKYVMEFSNDMESGHIDAKSFQRPGTYSVASHMYHALAQIYENKNDFKAARKALTSAATNAAAKSREMELKGNIRSALYWNRYSQDLLLKASTTMTSNEGDLCESLDYITQAARLLGKDNVLNLELTKYRR